MIKSGLVSISFRPYTPLEIMQACIDSGLKYIEWGSDVHAPADDLQKIQDIVNLQKQYGIECCSYGTYFRVGKDSVEDIRKYITAAKALGTNVLRIWCGTESSCDYSECQTQELIDDCKALAAIAAEENVTLCTEFHPGTFTDCHEKVLMLCDAVNSPNFKTYWQPNQHEDLAWNIKSSMSVAPIATNIHVYNWAGSSRYPLAEAAQEWQKYFNAFDGSHFALLEFMPDDKIETLKSEASALKTILGDTI